MSRARRVRETRPGSALARVRDPPRLGAMPGACRMPPRWISWPPQSTGRNRPLPSPGEGGTPFIVDHPSVPPEWHDHVSAAYPTFYNLHWSATSPLSQDVAVHFPAVHGGDQQITRSHDRHHPQL